MYLCLLSPALQCLTLYLLLVYQVNLDESMSHRSFDVSSTLPWRSTLPRTTCGVQLRAQGCCSASSHAHCWSSALRSRPALSQAQPWPGRRSSPLLGHPESWVEVGQYWRVKWVSHLWVRIFGICCWVTGQSMQLSLQPGNAQHQQLLSFQHHPSNWTRSGTCQEWLVHCCCQLALGWLQDLPLWTSDWHTCNILINISLKST